MIYQRGFVQLAPMVWGAIAAGAVIAVLLAALGVQSYRLNTAQGRIEVFEEREAAQIREQQKRALHNLQAKERADETFAAGRKRAASVVVQQQSTAIVTAGKAPDARSGDKSTACIVRGELERTVAEFAQWHGTEAARLVAEVSRLHAAEATRIARAGETVAAGYRVCRDYALEVE